VSGGKRERSGRKAVHIDLENIEKLAGIQCTDEEIAAFNGVSLSTIERRKKQPAFAEALSRGKSKGRVSLRRNLWSLANKGNPAANIFLAKNLLGYKDYFSNEHSGPDGGPIPMTSTSELKELSLDEIKQLIFLVGKTRPPDKA